MARIVRFHETGGPEVLRIEEVPPSPPGEGEVRIAVKAIGLNRAESLFRQGFYIEPPDLPSRLGYEAAGTVEAVGAGVTRFKAGDRVSTLPAFSMGRYGVYGDSVIVPCDAVSPFPGNLSFEEGASIWMSYLTAYGALVEHGGLRKGHHVLITAASSSVGHSAIQIVRAAGGIPIATTRRPEKTRELLQGGADHVIVTGMQDLAAQVMEITDGRGADLIFDAVAGPSIEALVSAAAREAILFVYGLLSMEPTPFPLLLAEGIEPPRVLRVRDRVGARADGAGEEVHLRRADVGGALAGHRPDLPPARSHRRGPPLPGIEPAERENRRHRGRLTPDPPFLFFWEGNRTTESGDGP
jgi:NADPH2:quinone reductase